MSSLERLVYQSTATGTTDSLLNLSVILAESQRNNGRDDLTGALAAHRDRYIQVIEGPSQTLDGLLRRLAKDSRHRDIQIIDRIPIAGRSFSGWTMASARIAPSQASALDALMTAERPSGPQIVALLRESLAAGAATT